MAYIQLDHEGNGTLELPNGHIVPINATNLAEARNTAVSHLVAYAQDAGESITVHSSDPAGDTQIIVHPDGRIHEAAATLKSDNDASHVERQPHDISSESSGPEPAPPVAPPMPPSAPPRDQEPPREPLHADSASHQPPAEAQSQPFAYKDHPDWKPEASRPATKGFKGFLNRSLRMTWPPTGAELLERQEEFTQRIQEQQAQQEENERLEHLRQVAEAEEASRHQIRERERQAENAKRERIIQTNFQGAQTILVANPKGGARKTTTSYLLGATFGVVRGGSTIAWDANETMGTLGERARKDRHNRTVVNLLEDGAEHLTKIESSRIGILDSYVRSQGNAHFDVLASDEDPSRQDIIDHKGFAIVHDILSRYYRIIILDTGNNIRANHFVAAQDVAQQLVIPVAASFDSQNRAIDMMAAFNAAGYHHLVENAIVLVHELEPIARDAQGNVIPNGGHELTAKEIMDAFEGKVREVLPIPFDRALKDGGEIDIDTLSPDTRNAYVKAAAAVASSLIDRKAAGK